MKNLTHLSKYAILNTHIALSTYTRTTNGEHMSQHPRTGNGTRSNAKYVKSTSYISYGMTRREALKFAFGAVTAAVLYGIPRTASAASATKETTDALNNAQAKYNEVQSQLNCNRQRIPSACRGAQQDHGQHRVGAKRYRCPPRQKSRKSKKSSSKSRAPFPLA